MMNLGSFNAALAKVMVAAGKEDLVTVLFTTSNDKNICQLTCCDGKGLQVMMSIAFTGNCTEGVAIVKASTLAGILRSYEALGFKEFEATIEKGETENVLILSNGKGSHKLALAEKMPSIDLKQAQEGAIYAAICKTKDLQNAVKSVAYAVGNTEYTAGIFFQAGEKGYTVMATDAYYGAKTSFASDFKMFGNTDAKMDFFVGTSGVKAIGALKGEVANMVITPKYLMLKDADGTMAVASMNAKAFPVQAMTQFMVNKNASLQAKPHLYDVEIKKSTVLALIELAEVTCISKDVKVISFKGEQKGEVTGLVCGTQSVEEAKLSLVENADEITFSTSLLRNVLTNISEEEIFVRYYKGIGLFYRKDSESCLAFLMGRGNK